MKHSLGVRVDIVHVNVGDCLIVTDIAIKSSLVSVVCAQQSDGALFILLSVRAVPCDSLTPSFNAILDSELNRRQGASERWTDHSLVNHPQQEIWMWALNWPSTQVVSYLDRMLI